MGGARDKIYHTHIGAFLYNVLSLAECLRLCEISGPLTVCYGSPVAVGSTLNP